MDRNEALGSARLPISIMRQIMSCVADRQPIWEAVSYRGLFTAGWFGVREKHCSQLKIYDRLRASKQAANQW